MSHNTSTPDGLFLSRNVARKVNTNNTGWLFAEGNRMRITRCLHPHCPSTLGKRLFNHTLAGSH